MTFRRAAYARVARKVSHVVEGYAEHERFEPHTGKSKPRFYSGVTCSYHYCVVILFVVHTDAFTLIHILAVSTQALLS